jgi:hypothetical protein
METIQSAIRSFFPPSAGTSNSNYTRTEKSHYVYKLHPDGKGATVASTIEGSYENRFPAGKQENQPQTGKVAGIFGGEVDQHGNLTQGGYQKILTEDGKEKVVDYRGSVDPTIFAEKVGLKKPSDLESFDLKKATMKLDMDTDELVDDLLSNTFTADPIMEGTHPRITM